MAREGFAWWIARLRSAFALFDRVRLDHFRGFEAHWEVPGADETAENGRWEKGPGLLLFDALVRALGPLPIVAENLGVITPEVEALRERYGFRAWRCCSSRSGPTRSRAASSRTTSRATSRRLPARTTTTPPLGWWTAGVGDTTRTEEDVQAERDFACAYLRSDGTEIHWDFVRAALGSVADTAIVPLQDVLGLGSAARMNVPAREQGNWTWRKRP